VVFSPGGDAVRKAPERTVCGSQRVAERFMSTRPRLGRELIKHPKATKATSARNQSVCQKIKARNPLTFMKWRTDAGLCAVSSTSDGGRPRFIPSKARVGIAALTFAAAVPFVPLGAVAATITFNDVCDEVVYTTTSRFTYECGGRLV
jgi:hypothetical protein